MLPYGVIFLLPVIFHPILRPTESSTFLKRGKALLAELTRLHEKRRKTTSLQEKLVQFQIRVLKENETLENFCNDIVKMLEAMSKDGHVVPDHDIISKFTVTLYSKENQFYKELQRELAYSELHKTWTDIQERVKKYIDSATERTEVSIRKEIHIVNLRLPMLQKRLIKETITTSISFQMKWRRQEIVVSSVMG